MDPPPTVTDSSSALHSMVLVAVYHMWVRQVKGTDGTNSVTSVAFSTDGTRPTSGNGFSGTTSGTSVDNPTLIRLMGEFTSNAAGSVDIMWDRTKIAFDQTIPSSP